MTRTHLALLLAGSLPACERPDPYDASLDILPPVATRAGLVYPDPGRDQLLFVRPADDERADLQVRSVPAGDEHSDLAWALATRDGAAVLALTVPASAKEEDTDEQLLRVAADDDGEPVVYSVRAPFTSAALSPDHRRAVLYFGSSASDEQLHNANQIALVDLTGDDAQNVTLNGFGGVLQTVQFPGQLTEGEPTPVQIGGAQFDIAAFLAAGELVLMNMDDPALDQVAVPLGADLGFAPTRTLLRPGNQLFADPALFVLSSSGGEVGMLTLLPEGDDAGFTAQISLISVGQSATDFAFHDAGDVPYLLTVDPGAGDLVFTDIRTQGGFHVPLDAPATALFLRDAEAGRQVVAWAPSGDRLATLDLAGIADSLGRKPKFLKIETGIDSLVRLDNDRLLIGSLTNLYVVDLRSEQVTPLSAQTPYDAAGSALVGEALLLGTAGQSWVSTVDLRTLSPESMLLDADIVSFHYLPGPQRIVVTHGDPVGHLTVVDPADPSRTTSRVHWGYLLQGVLD